MSDDKQGLGFGWFLFGLGLGAALGVLYAPKAGSETREQLRKGARDGSDYLKERSRVAADQVNDLIDTGKGQVNDFIDRGRAQWGTYVDRGRQTVSEQTERVSAAIDAGKQAYKATTTE